MPAVAMARRYLEHVATHLDVDPNSTECLKHPAVIHEITVPAERDDGTVDVVTGYRAPRQRSRSVQEGLDYAIIQESLARCVSTSRCG